MRKIKKSWDWHPKLALYLEKNLSLSGRLVLVFLVLLYIPTAVLVFSNLKNVRNAVIAAQRSELEKTADREQIQIDKTCQMMVMSANAVLAQQSLVDFLVRLRDDPGLSTSDYIDFYVNSVMALKQIYIDNHELMYIHVYPCYGSCPDMDPILYSWEEAGKTDWFSSYRSGGWQLDYKRTILHWDESNEKDHVFGYFLDINDKAGRRVGIIEVAVDMDSLFYGMYSKDEDLGAGLFCQGKTYPGAGGPDQTGLTDDILERARKMKDGESAFFSLSTGGHAVVARESSSMLDLVYILAANPQEVLGTYIRQRNTSMFWLLLLSLLSVFFISILMQRLLRKLYHIRAVVEDVRCGNEEMRTGLVPVDELGELGYRIDYMLDQIKDMNEERIQRELLFKNTQIRALQNQINVHFLHNVLESIKMLAEIREEYEVSDALTTLSQMLHYSLRWSKGIVTVGQELDYIKNYVSLVNFCHDFTVLLDIQIEEDLLVKIIPKMTLQPVVENAILHGIEETEEDAVIRIKSKDLGNDYLIQVTDSGAGMDQAALEALQKKVSRCEDNAGSAGHGIGLANVESRIRILCGADYGLEIYSKEGCYTKVEVRLPKRVETDQEIKMYQNM